MAKDSRQYQEASDYAANVSDTNSAMGYHDMADRANVAKKPQGMQGAKSRVQEMGKPGDGSGGGKGRDY